MNLEKIAVVVLNYITYWETEEFLESFRNLYPDIRVYVVDNGSPNYEESLRKKFISNYRVSFIRVEKNLGFAKGNNIGIKTALNSGYQYIVCSNNDIIVREEVLEEILSSFIKYNPAVVGPKIINLRGENQNPFLISRPSLEEAKFIVNSSSIVRRVLARSLKRLLPERLYIRLKEMRKKLTGNYPKSFGSEVTEPTYVYALHGAFIVFGPEFFKHYNGWDEGTFLFAEELILAEMLFKKNLKALYTPYGEVLHKEDRTSKVVWGAQDVWKPFLIARRSVRYWYRNWYSRG